MFGSASVRAPVLGRCITYSIPIPSGYPEAENLPSGSMPPIGPQTHSATNIFIAGSTNIYRHGTFQRGLRFRIRGCMRLNRSTGSVKPIGNIAQTGQASISRQSISSSLTMRTCMSCLRTRNYSYSS